MRGKQFVRQWRLLLMLRRSPRPLSALARALDCHERTVRRDLEVLQSVPLPVVSSESDDGFTRLWRVAETADLQHLGRQR